MQGAPEATVTRTPGETLSLALAALVALSAALAIAAPDVYANELPAWHVQIVVQDWVDLVALAPALAAAAILSRRGSRRSALVLGGLLMYAAYNMAIYAFAVRLNRLFLIYCASLGLAVYALVLHIARLRREDAARWFDPAVPVRFAAGLLMALAVAFGALWLSELIPVAVSGTPPASLAGTGLLTNPVHALDLSVTLPTLFLGGFLLWRRRAWGFVLAPMLLTFALVTDAAIVAIILASRAQGLPGEVGVAVAITASAIATLVAAIALLGGVDRGEPSSRPSSPRSEA